MLTTQSDVFRVLLAAAVAIGSSTAAATAQRTFVASTGSDVDPCSVTQPCRGFARAMTQTAADGEIVVLDSAGYGPVTITQGVSIIAPAGIYAGVTNGGGDGVVVTRTLRRRASLRSMASVPMPFTVIISSFGRESMITRGSRTRHP